MATSTIARSRREKLSIYLVKTDYLSDELILSLEKAKSPIALDLGQGDARLYVKREVPRSAPPWSRLFTVLPEVPPDTFGSPNSVGALLVYRLARTFLLSFGHGFHLINDEAVERDFGLRVTLNSVESGKLRSLDKASYDHNPLNYRTQSSRELDLFDLDLDTESEMLYAVTGTSKEPLFGSTITGRDALTLAVETDAKGVASILEKALERYTAKLPPEFEWFDNVSVIRDPIEQGILDLLLDDELKKPDPASLWLGEPEIVNWETQVGYSFDRRFRSPRYVVLDLEHLRKHLQEQGSEMTAKVLKTQSVHVNDADCQPIKSWTAYRCLYAELADGSGHFVLRNATWYRIKDAFVAKIDRLLATLPTSPIAFPSYAYAREDDYNNAVATGDATFHVMDKQNTQIGGPHDKIEFCDLIKDGEALVHVKHYRSSATLSHLFAQASVAAETFIRDEDFRVRLNPKLPSSVRLEDPRQRPDAARFRIVYAIATTKSLPAELPFFSKVTLKNAVSGLTALNFKVELAQIALDPNLSKTAKYPTKTK
jgi:uncharacterized protein (TIGR04141 family)